MIPSALVLGLLVAFAMPQRATAAENDFRVVDGVLARPLTLPEDAVAEVTADDQTVVYVDLRRLPRDQVRVAAYTPVTIIGYEAQRPDVIAAHILKFREAESVILPEPPRPRVELRMIEGVVQSVARRALRLRTLDGRTMTVRIGRFVTSSAAFLTGDRLKIFGVVDDDETLDANAVVHDTAPRATQRGFWGYVP
jgi:hypothetical protein